ncbi:MAG: signal peptide peptidase SppA [Acidobacteria bacterium RIFCSPHIGHO2_12_FULL_67_30]|nr:MAG: signal peptide peptidase SppA [Acidobacteria bacterium RIFCSPHIGHO2_01_FULL_67_28]OFV89854.1 MAG: signal peptide peptidase SppA [Acidobacteria bacterium RIFCSPHIGHO2_12_FULL_67_30]
MAVKKGRLFLLLLLVAAVGLIIAGTLGQAVPDKTVLELTLASPIAEEDWPDFGARFWEGDVVVFRDLLAALDRAKRDDRIAGISLEVSSNAGMNFGKMQELRAKLGELTAAGKFCTAYLEEGSNVTYYLASACPEIYLTPTSALTLTGLMGHTTFVRGTLDKLHIYPDLYHIAEYKTAMNLLTEKKFTAAHKEMVTDLVTGWQQQLVAGIAAGRKLEPAAVEQILRGGPYLAEEALAKKLIDKLLYYDQYRDLLKSKAGGDKLNTLGLKEYLTRSRAPRGPKIALVHATGAIVTGKSGYDPAIGRYMGSDTVAEALRAARKDDSVKAIVFRVDSGGGSAIASEIIRREVVLAREKKPVVVSMSDVAGSGGYWIAMSANKIVADPGTLTGSIGVVFGKLNIKGFYEMLGLSKDYVALAPNATLFYEFENFSPEQRALMMKFMRDIYDHFLDGVSKGRGLPVEKVDSIGKGRVYLGARAKELGLVDELGGLDRAVAVAKQLANIPAEQSVQFVVYPRPKTPFQQLTEWMQVRTVGWVPPRAWLDPTRSPLWKERALVLVPFELEPR